THEFLNKFWRAVTGCLSYESVSVISTEQCEVALAQARCIGEDSVEHGSKVRRRTGDHAQHLGHPHLLIERRGEVLSALAQLVEQARVLDRDDGLLGEIADKLDLLFRE